MVGLEVCHIHGGKSPRGPGHYKYVTGKYSRFLPARLAAAYKAAITDPKLLELRDEIAAVDARLIDLFTRVDTGEAGSIWRHAQDAMTRVRDAQAKHNTDAMMLALTQVERCIGQGAGDYAAWDEIAKQIEIRRKLVDSESRRLTAAHEVLTIDRAMLMLAQVTATLQKHITDKKVLGAIAMDLQRLGTNDAPTYALPPLRGA